MSDEDLPDKNKAMDIDIDALVDEVASGTDDQGLAVGRRSFWIFSIDRPESAFFAQPTSGTMIKTRNKRARMGRRGIGVMVGWSAPKISWRRRKMPARHIRPS